MKRFWKMAAAGFVAYHALTLIAYFVPLTADFLTRQRRRRRARPSVERAPRLVALAPSRHGAASLPGFVASLRAQDYPEEFFRVVLAIDRDDENDPSVEIAAGLGVEVHERLNPAVKTKGAALNAVLAELRGQTVDGVVVFDIDARPGPDFLAGVAEHFQAGAALLQGATMSRSAQPGAVARLSEIAQTIARSYQRGRAILRLPGFLSGGAMAFRRDALEALDWQTSTGTHLSDDGELNLRCCLLGLPVRYAADLVVSNEVPVDARELRLQRRRWSAGYQELAVTYFVPMLKKALRGDVRVLDYVAGLLFASTFSLTFAAAGALTVVFGSLAPMKSRFRRWAAATGLPFLLHGAIYLVVPWRAGVRFGWKEARGVPVFFAMRALAFVEGLRLAFQRAGRNPVPSRHRGDAAPLPAAGGE